MSSTKDYPFVKKHIQINDDTFIRVFDETIDDKFFEWHRDKRKRSVFVVASGSGWKFQYDDQLPFNLTKGQTINIEKEVYHKIYKGKGELVIYVQEY